MATCRQSEASGGSFILTRTQDQINYEWGIADVFATLVEDPREGGSGDVVALLVDLNIIKPVMEELAACLGQPYQLGSNALSGTRVESSTELRACEQKLRQQLREDCAAAAATYLPTPIATEPGYKAMLASHIWLGFLRLGAKDFDYLRQISGSQHTYDSDGQLQDFNDLRRGDTLWAACNKRRRVVPT